MLKTEHYKHAIHDFSLDKVVVGTSYDAEMQRKIHRFKFVHNHVDHVYFRELFAHMKEEFPYTPDIIVYPPISFQDRIFRGPNHARLLTEYYDPREIPTLSPFRKKMFSQHQSRRTRKERAKVREEYSLYPWCWDMLKGKKVLLIDDIITSGYTAHTLGKLLKKSGAKEVVGFFLASEKV